MAIGPNRTVSREEAIEDPVARLREGVARIFDPVAAGPPCVRALNVNLLPVGRKPHQVQTACQPRGEDPSSDHSALPKRGVLRER